MSSEIKEIKVAHIDGATSVPQILETRCQMVADSDGGLNLVIQFKNEDIIAIDADDIKDMFDVKNKSFGKFASAEELYEAYLNLEKNYTKKSQQLSKMVSDLEPKFKRGEMPYAIQFVGNRIEIIRLGKIRNIIYYPSIGTNDLIKYYEFEDGIKTRNERELFKTEEEGLKKLKEIGDEIWRI